MSPDLQPLTDTSRWALVTGASAGIGMEFSRQLAALGYHLVLVARRADRLHALASELQHEYGTACLVLPSDLARPESPREIVARLRKEDIFVEFLVNNAGYGQPGEFHQVDWPNHAHFMQVMVGCVCELTWLLLPDMQKRGLGHVINVSSVAGLITGSRGHTLYSAAKALLVRFSQSLALENEGRGVKVSALCPGFTHTEFHDVMDFPEIRDLLPGYMWLEAEEVVRYGIESVLRKKSRVVAVPGLFYKVVVRLHQALPGLGLRLTRRLSQRFRRSV